MLKSLMNTEPAKWQLYSTDWAEMELKEDADSIAVSLQNWNILRTRYGGAPEIPIFQY